MQSSQRKVIAEKIIVLLAVFILIVLCMGVVKT